MIDQDFTKKRNALFACLDNASTELKGTSLDQSKSLVTVQENTSGEIQLVYRNRSKRIQAGNSPERNLKHLRGKESIFKKPELPISKCLKPRKAPDYEINPHKWKKYSLADVDISEQTNCAAAFAFLRQIDEQKESQEKIKDDICGLEHKIEFKRICKIQLNIKSLEEQDEADDQLDVPKLKGSKLIMPEYVVGQKNKVINKKRVNNSLVKKEESRRAVGQLPLSHLFEDDKETEEEEEEEEGN